MKLVFAPLSSTARSALAAVACASSLAMSSVPFQAQAAVRPPASHLITQVTTARGETIRFNLLADGSVAVVGMLRASARHDSVHANHQQFATPLDLFRAAAPAQQAPLELIQANARYTAMRQQAGVAKIGASLKTAQAPRMRRNKVSAQDSTESWFINDYCNPASGSSYNVCYTDAWNWAYLSASSVYHGHAVVYAKDAALNFNVQPIGNWTVPQGWVWWADHYVYSPFGWFNFSFYAGVSYAQTFDFEADVNY